MPRTSCQWVQVPSSAPVRSSRRTRRPARSTTSSKLIGPPARENLCGCGEFLRGRRAAVHLNSGQPWTETEVHDLKEALAWGKPVAEIADTMLRDLFDVV